MEEKPEGEGGVDKEGEGEEFGEEIGEREGENE